MHKMYVFSNMCWTLVEILLHLVITTLTEEWAKIFAQDIHKTKILKEFFGLKKALNHILLFIHTNTPGNTNPSIIFSSFYLIFLITFIVVMMSVHIFLFSFYFKPTAFRHLPPSLLRTWTCRVSPVRQW